MQILDYFVFVELDSETWYAIFIFRQLFSGTPTSILAFVRAPGRRTWLGRPVVLDLLAGGKSMRLLGIEPRHRPRTE